MVDHALNDSFLVGGRGRHESDVVIPGGSLLVGIEHSRLHSGAARPHWTGLDDFHPIDLGDINRYVGSDGQGGGQHVDCLA